ncbi:MAG: hypothetical protein R3Y57_07075 [Erysipelotrichaceae bacterium]
MPVVALQCQSCGGELKFNAAKGKFICEFCGSAYTKEELEAAEKQATEAEVEKENTPLDEESGAVLYSCPNCGGEVISDETTAATECYYCHSPVILSGRVSGKYLPNRLIPFKYDKKAAIEKFREWTSKKYFLPKYFFNEDNIEKLSGVYFPYWIVDVDTHVKYHAEGDRVSSWTSGNYIYTKHSLYNVEREGDVHLEDIIKSALSKESKELIENVQPFDEQALEPFSMSYLSGFLAERRDIEQKELENEVHKDIYDYSKKVVEDSVTGYTSRAEKHFSSKPDKIDWEYGLLPVWTLTYMHNGKVYYYAMNGQSGKICGKLPVDEKKLLSVAGLVSFAILLVGTIVGYFFI